MSNATSNKKPAPVAIVSIDETARVLDETTDPARHALTIIESVTAYGLANGAWLERTDPARVPVARLVATLTESVIVRRATAAGVKVTSGNRADVLATPAYKDGMSRANVNFYFRAATVAETLAIPLDAETATALYRLATRHGSELTAWCESPKVARMTSAQKRESVIALAAKVRKVLKKKTTNDENGDGTPDAETVDAEGSEDSTAPATVNVGEDDRSSRIALAAAIVNAAATVNEWSYDERVAMRVALDTMHDALDSIELRAVASASV